MGVQEELESALDKIDEVLSKALGAVEGFDEDNYEADSLPQAMNRLADTLHMRLSSLPKETEYVRLSRFNFAMLSTVISKWAGDLETIGEEYRELARETKKAWDKIEETQKTFEESREKVKELLDKHAPEIDIKSDLQDAERT